MVNMLTSGQLCVLFPQGLPERRMDDTPKGRIVSRCLFGRPDPEETRKLFEEELATNRERMLHQWGFDILTERLAIEEKSSPPNPPRSTTASRPPPYIRQTRISDFWRKKKSSCSVKTASGNSSSRGSTTQTEQ